MLEVKGYEKKIIPILIDGLKINSSSERLKYLSYWEKQISELELSIKSELISIAFTSNIVKDLEHLITIREKLDKFFNYLTEHLCFTFSDLEKTKFADLGKKFGVINKRPKPTPKYISPEKIDRIKLNTNNEAVPLIDVYRLLLNISYQPNIEIQVLLGHFQEILNNISSYFSQKTEAKCSASLTLITVNKDKARPIDVEVKIFMRDSKSAVLLSEFEKIKHRIYDNTAYTTIMENLAVTNNAIFFSNDLTEARDFKVSAFYKQNNWPLPYKSIICVPIFNGHYKRTTGPTIIGFLNLDCEKTNIFLDEDSVIVRDIGMQLFFPLKELHGFSRQ